MIDIIMNFLYIFINSSLAVSSFSNSEIFQISFQFNLYYMFMFRCYYIQMNIIIFIFIQLWEI